VFLSLEVVLMFSEDVKNPHNDMVMLLVLASKDEDVVHHHLECHQAISETKEHD